MFEPSRDQMNAVEELALHAQTVACMPLAHEGANLIVDVTGIPEPMGFTTRAPRCWSAAITADGRLVV